MEEKIEGALYCPQNHGPYAELITVMKLLFGVSFCIGAFMELYLKFCKHEALLYTNEMGVLALLVAAVFFLDLVLVKNLSFFRQANDIVLVLVYPVLSLVFFTW